MAETEREKAGVEEKNSAANPECEMVDGAANPECKLVDGAAVRGWKKYYHVIIAACCFLILFLNTGLPSTSFNVYQSYLVQIDGIGDFGGSLIVTVRTFVSLVAIFFVSAYYAHIDLRRGVLIASFLTAIGFFVYGFADDIWMYCAGSVFTGLGYGLGGMVATTALLGNWYRGRVGTVVGVSSMGSSFASIVIPLAVAAIIHSADLSFAFYMESVLALAVTLFLLVFLRTTPEAMGLSPTEERIDESGEAKDKVHIGRENIGRRELRIMLVAVFLLGASCVVGYSYFSVLISTSGIDLALTAVLTSLLGISLTVSKLTTGWIFDRVGSRRGSAIFFVILVVGLLCCFAIPFAEGLGVGAGGAGAGGSAGAGDVGAAGVGAAAGMGGGIVMAIAAAVLFGFGSSLATTGLSIWSLELSSATGRMRVVKNFQVAYAFGGCVFNIVPGIIAELTGGYEFNYLMFAVFMVVCAVLVLGVYKVHYARERQG